ncbi:MAG: hypothetical protein R3C61_20355 [Bacteroidia bacterium]
MKMKTNGNTPITHAMQGTNVLSTVSDRKLQLTTDEETVSGYTADVWGMSDPPKRTPSAC